MGSDRFRLRADIQGRQQHMEQDLSAEQVQETLQRQIEDWLASPHQLLRLTCGDTRFTVWKAEDDQESVAEQPAATAPSPETTDIVTEQSEESFPASDPPSSTGSIVGSLRR